MLSGHELESLLHSVAKFKGGNIRVTEQLSLSSSDNWNRHHTTTSTFMMYVKTTGCAFSGMRLFLLGEDASYELFARRVVRYEVSATGIEIIEHIEGLRRWTRIELL